MRNLVDFLLTLRDENGNLHLDKVTTNWLINIMLRIDLVNEEYSENIKNLVTGSKEGA